MLPGTGLPLACCGPPTDTVPSRADSVDRSAAAEMFNLYELCGIQIGITIAPTDGTVGPIGSPLRERKPNLSSDPASPRKRNAEEIAANRQRALAKVSFGSDYAVSQFTSRYR